MIFTNFFFFFEKKESVYVQERELLICVTFEIKDLGLLSQHIAYLIRSVEESVSAECKAASTLVTLWTSH
jgi:hypothetical protein